MEGGDIDLFETTIVEFVCRT